MSKNLKIESAFRDKAGWILFGENDKLIESWPSDWPEVVDVEFLTNLGIEID